MDSAFIYQAANELVKNAGTRNIKQIARSCSLDISETSRIKDMLGLLSLYFDKPLILINRQLDKVTVLNHHLLRNLPVFPNRCGPLGSHPLVSARCQVLDNIFHKFLF